MKLGRLLGTTALGVLISGGAWAADMAVPYYKAASPAPPLVAPWTWTGFYIGVNGGSGWGANQQNVDVGAVQQPPPKKIEYDWARPLDPGLSLIPGRAQNNTSGFLGGAQVGLNYQLGVVVVGLESDFDWSNIQGADTCAGIVSCHTKVPWFADVTGRLGFTVDHALIYAKGGIAWAQFDYTDTSAATNTSINETRNGFVLGAGIEYGFLPNWSAKIEYDFYDFGSANSNLRLFTAPTSPVVPIAINNEERFHVLKFGINYKIF